MRIFCLLMDGPSSPKTHWAVPGVRPCDLWTAGLIFCLSTFFSSSTTSFPLPFPLPHPRASCPPCAHALHNVWHPSSGAVASTYATPPSEAETSCGEKRGGTWIGSGSGETPDDSRPGQGHCRTGGMPDQLGQLCYIVFSDGRYVDSAEPVGVVRLCVAFFSSMM